MRENLIWFRKVSVYWETDRESLMLWKKRNILAKTTHPKYSANAALRWNTIWRDETSRTVGFLARGWKHQETGPLDIPANYGDRVICSNSTWKETLIRDHFHFTGSGDAPADVLRFTVAFPAFSPGIVDSARCSWLRFDLTEARFKLIPSR